MKYQAEDGKMFDTERECLEHEAQLTGIDARAEAEAHVDSFVDDEGKPIYEGPARTRMIAEILGWRIRYELETHPERYSVAPDEPERFVPKFSNPREIR